VEEFFKLRADKQSHIIDAAFTVFSQNAYKKASMGDVAAAAGISKAMVFYYFGNKKSLYLHLIGVCGDLLTTEFAAGFDADVTDFFDRIRAATVMKMDVMMRHPYVLPFIEAIYHETDPEVADDVHNLVAAGASNTWETLLQGADVSKFADPDAPRLLAKLLNWAGEGMANADSDELNAQVADFVACLELMKKHFYVAENTKKES